MTSLPHPPLPTGVLEIGPADAFAHELPPIGFRIGNPGVPMIGTPFPEPGSYAVFSGPPGGLLTLRVDAAAEPESDADAALRGLTQHLQETRPFHVVDRGTLVIAGAPRAAVAIHIAGAPVGFPHGEAWCAALVGAAAGTLLVWFGVAHRGEPPITCAALAETRDLGRLVRSLALT